MSRNFIICNSTFILFRNLANLLQLFSASKIFFSTIFHYKLFFLHFLIRWYPHDIFSIIFSFYVSIIIQREI